MVTVVLGDAEVAGAMRLAATYLKALAGRPVCIVGPSVSESSRSKLSLLWKLHVAAPLMLRGTALRPTLALQLQDVGDRVLYVPYNFSCTELPAAALQCPLPAARLRVPVSDLWNNVALHRSLVLQSFESGGLRCTDSPILLRPDLTLFSNIERFVADVGDEFPGNEDTLLTIVFLDDWHQLVEPRLIPQ
jgi:hypothetical protein